MKKFFLMSIVMLMLALSCKGDSNIVVVINEDGTTSNGSVFSAIDDKNFYLDYIKYTVEEGHLVVTGYDEDGFKGVAEIVSRITYKGNTYEVLKIGEDAFNECDGLTSVIIPNSVTSIGEAAFHYCDGLTSVTIPNNVTSIGDSAFRCCSGLTSVTIPNSVTNIDANAFYECSRLTSIKCMRKTPPSIYIDDEYGYDYYPFAPEIYQDATLYVPKGSLYAYKNAEEWKKFKHIVEE